MSKKESKFRSITAKKEVVATFEKVAGLKGMSSAELLGQLGKHEALIHFFLKKIGNAKISGPFVRKNGNKLEKYFLVDKEEVVMDEWTNIENAKAVQITE
jgi:hypothetical protein